MNPSQNDIIRLLTQRSGLVLNEGKYQKAAVFVSTRLRAIGVHSHAAYRKYLESPQGAGEVTRFMAAFGVGETAFFRNANHWRAFREHVLPEIIKRKAGAQRGLRFWSAGCATGEEAYTLAICLWQALEHPQLWDLQIVATDINGEALAKGREGRYSAYSFRGVDMHALEDHFEKTKGRYRIKERFRQMVAFGELNLVASERYPFAPGAFDAVFCRNVLMYFRPQTAEKVIHKIVACLPDDGFLFLGHAEGSLAPRDILTPTACCDTFIYRKKGKAKPAKGADAPLHGVSSGIPSHIKEKHRLPPARLGTPHLARMLETAAAPDGIAQRWHSGDTDAAIGPYGEAFNHYVHEEYDRALSILLKAGAEEETRLRELVLIGLIFYNRSALNQAEIYRRQAHQLSPTSPEVYALEAMIKAARGDDEGAMRANGNAIFLDRGFFAPNFALAQLHAKRGDTAAAKRHFSKALEVLDADAAARVRLFYGLTPKQTLAQLCKRE